MSGKAFVLNRKTGEIESRFQPHQKKITGIFLREASFVVTSSFDGFINFTSLRQDKPNKQINPKGYEISCLCYLDNPNREYEMLIGFVKGDMQYYNEYV